MPIGWLTSYKGDRIKIDPVPDSNSNIKRNIIFITDESVRAKNLSLYGYQRKTTPYLEELWQNGMLKRFDSCVAATTCSNSTSNILLSGIRIEDLPDFEEKNKKIPNIYQYAKAMGYKTHFIDGQQKFFWNQSYQDQKFVDNWKNIRDFTNLTEKPFDIDFEIAKEINQIISSSTGNFIWVWKRGIHGPYFDDFPLEKAEWKPISNSYQLKDITQEELVNTYDNAIKYNLDNFFKILVPKLKENPETILIYTSDHGQNLLESGELVTHCSVSKNEANVPLFVIGNIGVINTKFKATHGNLFATLLDLMKFPQTGRKYQYEDSLLNPNAKMPDQRFYWSLDITQGRKYSFDETANSTVK